MKRLLLASAALAIFGGAGNAMAEQLPLGWFGSFEGSYARAFKDDGTPAVVGQQGNVLDTKSKNGFGLGVNLGYRFRGGWDFGVGVSGVVGFDKDTNFAGAYAPIAGTQNAGAGPIGGEAKERTSYFAIDFTAGYDLGLGMELPEDTTLRAFGGVRVANLSQTQEVNGNPYDFSNENKSRFTGAGPRLGVEGQYGLGGGFSIFGGVSGSILMGQISRELTTDSNYPGVEGSNKNSGFRTVYEAQGELGLGYSLAGVGAEGATIQVGYRADYWWNATDNSSGVNAFDDYTGATDKGDVGFQGPFMRVNFQF